MNSSYMVAWLLTVACLLSGCSPIRTFSVDTADVIQEVRRDIITSSHLSPESLQAVRMAGTTEETAIDECGRNMLTSLFEKFNPSPKYIYVESEISLACAIKREKQAPDLALAEYLHAAKLSLDGIFSPECQSSTNLLCDNFKVFYLRAIGGALKWLKQHNWKGFETQDIVSSLGQRYQLMVSHDSQFDAPENYDSLEASALIGLEGLPNRHARYGLGIAITACRARKEDAPEDLFLPKVGVCLPITAVISFPPETCNGYSCLAQVQFHNALITDSVNINNHITPLAAAFTPPLARMVEKSGVSEYVGLFSAFSDSDKLLKRTGFFTLEPYDLGKIPLVTVHGLFSSPLTWLSLHNDLMGDPVIRKNYQIWHYLYPTNLPIIANAKTFREKLDDLEAHLSATSQTGVGLRNMVIISHSMGGLLARTAVVHDSSYLKEFFFGSPETMSKLSPEIRQELSQYLDFQRKPYVDRVIFVAVPHRGSFIADNWIGWIGRSLISLPKTILQTTSTIVSSVKDYVRPSLRDSLEAQDATSVKGLSPENPFLQALSQLAIDKNVPFHSIIGDQGKGGGVNSSDGVVPYSSSHLEGAESELIVPADHSAHMNPLAVQEIKRILYLHLDKLSERVGPFQPFEQPLPLK